MQTYYQKHRTIKAFQFNGTWQQLREELPKSVFSNIYSDVINGYTFGPGEELNETTNQIERLELYDDPWPKHNVRTGDRIGPMISKADYMKYQLHGFILIPGDYITIHYFPMRTANMQCPHDIGDEMRTNLKIYHKNDFEAHWRLKKGPVYAKK